MPVKSVGIIVLEEVRNYGKIVFVESIVEKGFPPLDPPLTHLLTVGTEIAAPHKQQVTVAVIVATEESANNIRFCTPSSSDFYATVLL